MGKLLLIFFACCLSCAAQLPVVPLVLQSPTSVGALVMWVDASNQVFKTDTVTPAGNGDNVGKWGDISGSGNHLWNTNTAGNFFHLPVYNVVGGNRNFVHMGILTNASANFNQTNTWIMAIRDNTTTTVSLCFFNPGPSGNQFSQWNTFTSPYQYQIYAGTAVNPTPNPFMSASVFHVVTIQWSGANSLVRVDGTNTWTVNPGTGGCNGLTMGAFFNGNAPALQDMQEFRWYNGFMDQTTIHGIETTMGTRWGITIH